MDWEEYVAEIASDIMKEQSPKRFDIFVSYCIAIFLQYREHLNFVLVVSIIITFLFAHYCQ